MFMSWTLHCPVCGRGCTTSDMPQCGHDASFVADVSDDDVLNEVDGLPCTRFHGMGDG